MNKNPENMYEQNDDENAAQDTETLGGTEPVTDTEEAAEDSTTAPVLAAGSSINWGKEILDWIITIAIAIAITFAVKAFIFDVVKVDGSSMFPTLVNNDRLIVWRLGYNPDNSDIIILDSNYNARMEYIKNKEETTGKTMSAFDKFIFRFTQPSNLKPRYYVKRIIATSGQTIDFKDGKVLIDGVVLDEPYYTGDTLPPNASGVYPRKIPDGFVFVMGDNRDKSLDSRSTLGLVSNDAILGKAVFRIFPFNKIGVIK